MHVFSVSVDVENEMKILCNSRKDKKVPRSGRVSPVKTCTILDRWVASVRLYCFQRPTADGSREACKPPERTGVPYDEMWVYKELITHPAGHYSVYREERKKSVAIEALLFVREDLLHEEVVDFVDLLLIVDGDEKLLAVFHLAL